jgi:hypothetical protein
MFTRTSVQNGCHRPSSLRHTSPGGVVLRRFAAAFATLGALIAAVLGVIVFDEVVWEEPTPTATTPVPTTPPPAAAAAPHPETLNRPYSDASPFNTPIPADVEVLDDSDGIVANSYLGATPAPMRILGDPSVDWSHPVYFARGDDPSHTIDCASGGVTGHVVRIPAGARPTASSDGHMAIVQPDGWEYDLWQARAPADGIVRCNIGYRQRYDGPGTVTPDMKREDESLGGGTAPYFGLAAGLIRAHEIEAGTIPHALFVVIRTGASGSVHPAFKADATGNDDGPRMGQRFQLNMSDAAIDGSCAPGWEKTVAKAMAHYGLYFGDTGGAGFAPMMESPLTYTAVGQPNPWDAVAARYEIPRYEPWGYVFRWSGCIDYGAAMRAIAPPPKTEPAGLNEAPRPGPAWRSPRPR